MLTFPAAFINIPSVSFLQAQERDVEPPTSLGTTWANTKLSGLLEALLSTGCGRGVRPRDPRASRNTCVHTAIVPSGY